MTDAIIVGIKQKIDDTAIETACDKCKETTYVHGCIGRKIRTGEAKEVLCFECFKGTVSKEELLEYMTIPEEQAKEIRRLIPGFSEEHRRAFIKWIAKKDTEEKS